MTTEVLLQLETALRRSCQAIFGLPLDESMRLLVTVHPHAARTTVQDAHALYDALESQLLALGGRVSVPACGGTYLGTGQCKADGYAAREHNVLVAVEDDKWDIDPQLVGVFRGFASHVLIPVTENGRRAVPSPALARNIMLRYPKGRIRNLVPDVLEQARIGTDAFRVFISYKHDDCAAAASQIFHILAEERFAVFLDRFVGAPGEDFVGRIMSELFDKSCVLALETPNVATSSWVFTEVATARAHRLGLLAVDLPGSLQALRIGARLDCRRANRGYPLGKNGTLAKPELDAIANFVRNNIAPQGARRRRWQRRMLREAVRRSPVTDGGETPLGRRITAKGQSYLVALAARPPGAHGFKRVQEAALKGERRLIFAPLVHQLPGDSAVTDWLAGVSVVLAMDEGQMLAALNMAAAGTI
jgi:hypothetical protein